ncbi:pyridoxamine 5'-phosphate oxidase family protein [Caulobacter sp.]|uniref:pyridoxamine 5'-phosphate oxidase family protein n=1 Tax=Caulobacter sp. TaxID=78 RepID=UPI003BB14D17
MDRIETNTEMLGRRVQSILAENRIMAVATLRADGWPQTTMVGYVYDGLVLYFVINRASQKLANTAHDPRVSIAIGHHESDEAGPRGLSLAATVTEVTDADAVRRLNALIQERYPEQAVFTPSGASIAVMKALPVMISLIDPASGQDQPLLLRVDRGGALTPEAAAA